MLRTVVKKIGGPSWVSGSAMDPFDVPRNFPIVELRTRVLGRYSVTNQLTALQAEDIRNILPNVQLVASDDNGDVALINASSRGLYRHQHFFTGTEPDITEVTTLAVGVADYDFEVTIPLPILMPANQPQNYMTMLAAFRLNRLILQLTGAVATDIGSGGASAFHAYGSGSGTPSIRLDIEVPEDIDLKTLLTSLYRLTEKRFDVSAANADLYAGTNLNLGSIMQGAILYAQGTDANGTRTARDTIVNSDRFEASSQVLSNQNWTDARKAFKSLAALETLPSGYTVHEFTKGGDVRKGIDTRGWSNHGIEFEHHVDTNGNQGSDTSSALSVMQRELIIRS